MTSEFRTWISHSLIAVLGAFLVASCQGPTSQGDTGKPATAAARKAAIAQAIDAQAGNPAAQAEAILGLLTLEEKAGQVLVIGFDGPRYDDTCRTVVERLHVGGVILFARNVESPAQTARLTNELQASATASGGIGLLVAIDQEGGRVARLTAAKGFTEFPGGMALGATARNVADAAANAHRVGEAMAREMRAVGINVDFAPDLDVNNNPANPVIGVRSYGSNPARVAALGVAFANGLQANGVLAFGKHFPGHGDTGTDSHLSLPVVAHDRARLEAVEFVPFRAAIAANIAGIMSAHISFPTIEPATGLPATLSANVLQRLLREELGYQGLLVTDSLEMGALAKGGFPSHRAAAVALAAGADLLLFNAGHAAHEEAHRQIMADVLNGIIPRARLDEAVRRILLAKARNGLLRPAPAKPEEAGRIAGAAAHQSLAADLARKAITLVADSGSRLPLGAGVKPVVIALPAASALANAVEGTEVRVADRPSPANREAALAAIRANPGAPVLLTLSGAASNPAQAALAKAVVASGAPTILIALREPYDLLPAIWGGTTSGGGAHPTLIATYGVQPTTLGDLAALLRGRAKPEGHLSVDLPGLHPEGTGLDEFARR